MAAAEPVTDDPQPVKRTSSFNFLPPFMSELRVVLLGNSWSERSSVGNFILGEIKLNTEEEPEGCLRVQGQLRKKEIVLINTPDLLHPSISGDKLRKQVESCLRLSDPGPHVFLVVLQPEDFTEERKLKLCRVLKLFGDQSFDHCLIQISTPREESPGFMDKDEADQPLKDMIRLCHYRYLNQKSLDHSELLTRLGQIAKENSGQHVSSGVFEDAGLTMTPTSRHITPALNLVLCGRTGAGKTSAAKAILGRTELHSVSNSPECIKHQGEVCGRWVTLVELPALNGKPQEEVMEQALRCISLCDPEGVHAFIQVLPVGPLNDEDKGELATIQNTFGSRVNEFTMILFTVESDPTAPDVVQFINKDNGIQEHCQSCGGRHFVLNIKDQPQIPELLDDVEKMGRDGSRCFMIKMFTKAQVGEVSKPKAKLQDVKHGAMEGYGEYQSRECLRMVLIGKNSSCKSATANTILGKKHFTQKQADKSCKKTTGEIDGRPVTVINIPDMFDATGKIQQEIAKCHSTLSPGPHVFLLVLQIGNIRQEEKDSVELIKRYFGKDSGKFIIIIFTKGDELKDQSFESYIEDCDDFVKQLINDCGRRYQVFNNKDDTHRTQARELLANIETMVKKNGGCYKTGIFDPTEGYTEIQKREKAEMKGTSDDLQRKHEKEMRTLRSKIKEEERKLREKRLQEKDEIINKERKERKKERVETEKRWKKQVETLQLRWRKKLEASERMVQTEREQKENATEKLEQVRKEIKREQDWHKERKDFWEQNNKENKQRLEEEKISHRKLQDEYNCKRKILTYCFVALLLIVSFLLYYLFLS